VTRSQSITVFDGHQSIGGTKILLQSEAVRLILDFGTNYKRTGELYEEFLQPRPSRGLTDWLAVGLLPRIKGIYREDLFPSADFPDLDRNWSGETPSAVLLTHGHLDHAGGLAFLKPEIPIVCTPMTLALLRAWQEGGNSPMQAEVTYLGERKSDSSGRLIVADRGAPKVARTFSMLEEAPDSFLKVLETSPYGERTAYEPSAPSPAPKRWDGLELRWSGVDHSVYGAVGFLLEADGVVIGYTGDLRFAGERRKESQAYAQLLEKQGSDLVLIVEGTRLTRPGDSRVQRVVAEDVVETNCRRAVERYRGKLVIADFGPRNVERLRTFRRIALVTGRQLVVTPKDAYLLHVLHSVDSSIELDMASGGMRIIEEPSAEDRKVWQKEVTRLFDSAFISPSEIAAHKERWILCFSFYDCNDLVDLRGATEGGLWLYSSSEAHGEESEFDFMRLQNWILWAGMHQVGFRYTTGTEGEPQLTFDHPDDVGHHSSGHATQGELLDFIKQVAPKAIIPVHTEQTPKRYEELLRAHGVETIVIPPGAGVPISLQS
jgi:ribonuclease J